MKYIIANDGTVTAVVSGQAYCFGKSHPNYNKLINHLKNNNVEHFEASYDIISHVNAYCDGYVNCQDGGLSWDGIKMPDMFTGTILDMIKQGFPFEPMLNFLDNLSQNPSDHAVIELFDFMENKSLGEAARAAFAGDSPGHRISRAATGHSHGGRHDGLADDRIEAER
jgi:hypothetical protein